MPRGKKATGRAASASTSTNANKQQSALSFGGRVTKPGTSTRSASGKKADEKAAIIERGLSATVTPVDSQAEESDSVAEIEVPAPASTTSGVQGLVGGKTSETTTAELAIREQAHAEQAEPKSAEELEAEKVPETQIKKYWAGKEAERTTKRVHQEGLSLHERVLREFDMSSQYGPCIGVARTRRWKLAHELGLEPAIEVLSVLMKEDAKGKNKTEEERLKVQRAYVDELLSSKFVVD